MSSRKIGAGAVFVGAVIGAMVGAGSAQAAPSETGNGPGISYSANGGPSNGFGNGVATKTSGENSQALAIRTGLTPGGTSNAEAHGDGATAVSIDGYTVVRGSNSHGFAALGQTNIGGADNNVVTVLGDSNIYQDASKGENVHGNFVVNMGGTAYSHGQSVKNAGEVSVSFCGGSVSGQAAHITTVGPGACK